MYNKEVDSVHKAENFDGLETESQCNFPSAGSIIRR
jgi:hypothetical protein